jgi:hypothetical protein
LARAFFLVNPEPADARLVAERWLPVVVDAEA